MVPVVLLIIGFRAEVLLFARFLSVALGLVDAVAGL